MLPAFGERCTSDPVGGGDRSSPLSPRSFYDYSEICFVPIPAISPLFCDFEFELKLVGAWNFSCHMEGNSQATVSELGWRWVGAVGRMGGLPPILPKDSKGWPQSLRSLIPAILSFPPVPWGPPRSNGR